MKKIVLAGMMAFGMSSMVQAADRCNDPELFAPNSWLITLNEEDQSTKQDLLDSLKLLSTGGFEIKNLFDFTDDPDLVFAVKYRPSYYSDPARRDVVKNTVLDGLSEIPGVTIRCDSINHIMPSMGVRSL